MVEDRCAFCGRSDVDGDWLWITVSRLDPEEDCEFDEHELSFCGQQHAGAFLVERQLSWEKPSEADRRSGTRVDQFFLGCGLLAIVLSVLGIVTIVRWVL